MKKIYEYDNNGRLIKFSIIKTRHILKDKWVSVIMVINSLAIFSIACGGYQDTISVFIISKLIACTILLVNHLILIKCTHMFEENL